jgi:hypothetical protein
MSAFQKRRKKEDAIAALRLRITERNQALKGVSTQTFIKAMALANARDAQEIQRLQREGA